MRPSETLGRFGVVILDGLLLAPVCACNVTAHPFESLDAEPPLSDDADADAASDGGIDRGYAGNHRPCGSARDCFGSEVCRGHLCVPPSDEGGPDGEVFLDAGAETDDPGTPDGGCLEKMTADPPSVDFGLVTAGCASKDVPVAMENTGCAMLVVIGLEILPQRSAMIITSAPVTPFPLEPGNPLEAVLRYHPIVNGGTESATLRVQTSKGVFSVPLRGTATLASTGADTFVQPSPPSTSFHLSRWPDPTTIRATINGKVINEDLATGWTYVETNNHIVFGAHAVPPIGATVEVTYEAECF